MRQRPHSHRIHMRLRVIIRQEKSGPIRSRFRMIREGTVSKKTNIMSAQIRAARALLNWSARELSERSGVSQSSIHRAERAKAHPSMHEQSLAAIKAALERGVSGRFRRATSAGSTLRRPSWRDSGFKARHRNPAGMGAGGPLAYGPSFHRLTTECLFPIYNYLAWVVWNFYRWPI